MLFLGIDPGFSSLGYAAMRITKSSIAWTHSGVIRTKKSDRKQNVFAASDIMSRAQEINRELFYIMSRQSFSCVCIESISPVRSSSVMAKMGVAYGVIASLVGTFELPLIQCSPQETKKRITQSRSASKKAMHEHLVSRFAPPASFSKIPSSVQEHAVDAACVILACLDSDVARALAARERFQL